MANNVFRLNITAPIDNCNSVFCSIGAGLKTKNRLELYTARLERIRNRKGKFVIRISFGCENYTPSWWRKDSNIRKICKKHGKENFFSVVKQATGMMLLTYEQYKEWIEEHL